MLEVSKWGSRENMILTVIAPGVPIRNIGDPSLACCTGLVWRRERLCNLAIIIIPHHEN